MKLIMAVVHGRDAGAVIEALTKQDYRVTRLNSAGGFLRQSNATLYIGVDDNQVDQVMGIISENCHTRTQFVNPVLPVMEPGELYMPNPVEVQLGGATIFVLNVERYERV